MKEKTRRILIMIVMAALIVSLMAASFAALTYGRYSGGRRDENSPYEDYIDFVGATAYEVRTPEQFVNAINNGYSYIKIAADAEEPFVVNNDIANVYTNLVIDVNGKTVIRNSRNPVLDVSRNISVVLVYDSSEKAKGGFYNPVGSALQTSGGSLTVGSGVYESGPKTDPLSSVSGNVSATVYSREVRTGKEYTLEESTAQLPKLTKDVYLENDVTEGYLRNDTYLIYTKENNCYEKGGQLLVNCTKTGTEISGTSFRVESDVASCDFYYYYPVSEANEDGFYTYAVVYGYNDVKGLAEDSTDDTTAVDLREKGLVWPYAAIRSVEDPETQEDGNTHARGGAFTTNFGTDNTYGILSVGGEMTVGTESATAPPTFTAVGEGTCIGMSAQTSDTLTIASGSFSSQVGDTILMRGGEMTVTGGTFTKSGNKARPSGGLEDIEASRTALIHMLGGELTIDGTVTGESDSRTYSVNMTAGSTDAPLTNVFGIYSTEDDTSGRATAGTVSVSGCSIAVNGTYSAGVLSSAGTVNLGGKAAGKAETNITVNNSISNNLLTSSAVSSEGGIVNLRNTVSITSDSLGITARGTINVGDETTQAAANVTVNTENATGVYVNNGSLTVDTGAVLKVDSAISSASYSWVTPPGTSEPTNAPNIYNGVYVQNGSLTSSGTLDVTFTGVQSDNVGTGNNSDLSYVSRWIDGSRVLVSDDVYRNFQVKSYAVRVEGSNQVDTEGNPIDKVTIAAGSITNSVGGGVLVTGGGLTLGQGTSGPAVNATAGEGIVGEEDTLYYDDYRIEGNTTGNWAYSPPIYGGDAVKVDGGTLTIHGGEYKADYGNGILVSDGTATVNGGTFTGNDNRDYDGGLYTGAGSNYGLKVLGGSAVVNGGTFIDWELDEEGNRVSGGGGGVFIMGTPTEEGETPKVTTIEKAIIDVTGATGVALWEYANVVFGTEDSTNNSDLSVRAESTGMTVEYTRDDARQNITIYSGTFESYGTASNKNGIWYGEGGATLNIEGGVFKGSGSNGRGLLIANNPNGEIEISGGTFVGGTGGSAISGSDSVLNGERNWWGGYEVEPLSTHDIIASSARCYYNNALIYNSSSYVIGGDSYGNVNLTGDVYNSSNVRIGNFNALRTIVVQ